MFSDFSIYLFVLMLLPYISLLFFPVWSAVNAICVTEEMQYSPEVEWENPPTDMHYYKLKFRSVLEIDEKHVMVAKSNDPKSRYILSGKYCGYSKLEQEGLTDC